MRTEAHRARQGRDGSRRRDYRSLLDVHLRPQIGELRLERITQREIEQWLAERQTDGTLPPRTAHKSLTVMHAIMERTCKQHGLPINPVANVERHAPRYDAGRYSFFTVEEVHALARAAGTPPTNGDTPPSAQQLAAAMQDATIILTAAFSGLRLGELLALRVRDVDFGAQAIRVLGSVDVVEGIGTPKSGHGRVVPLVPDLAIRLAQLLERDSFTAPDDYLFVGESGDHLDGSALRRRFKAVRDRAKLPPLRFHDLRHTFGSLAINEGSTREVQQWLGHADARTTQRYLHYKRRADEAQRLARAFTAAGSALQPFTHDSTANPRLL